jgi:hypothetical protein
MNGWRGATDFAPSQASSMDKFAGSETFIASTDLCFNFTHTKQPAPEPRKMDSGFRKISKLVC